jgi:hypothetical protein
MIIIGAKIVLISRPIATIVNLCLIKFIDDQQFTKQVKRKETDVKISPILISLFE